MNLARIPKYWFKINLQGKLDELLDYCLLHCENQAKSTPKMQAAFHLKDLIPTSSIGDAKLYIYKTHANIFGMDISAAHLVQNLLSQFQLLLQLTHLEVQISFEEDVLSEIYTRLTNIYEQSLVKLEDPPTSCDVLFLSASRMALSIKVQGTELEDMDFVGNASTSTIVNTIGKYESRFDEISVKQVHDHCIAVMQELGDELVGKEIFAGSEVPKILRTMEMLPSKAFIDFHNPKTKGNDFLQYVLDKYYPHLTQVEVISGRHTTIMQDGKILRIPIIDRGLDFSTLDIVSLDLSDHIPMLGKEEEMDLSGLQESGLTRLLLANITSTRFPKIVSQTLEELVITKSSIGNLEYDLQESLPNLKRLYLDCRLATPDYFQGWDIEIHKGNGVLTYPQ